MNRALGTAVGLSLAVWVGCRLEASSSSLPEMQFEALPLRAPVPADNPSIAAKVELGRLLFFDPILSSTKDVACATCHHPGFGWGDGRSTPVGVGGAGLGPLRTFQGAASLPVLTFNAPSLLNVGFNGLVAGRSLDPGAAPMFWDARVQGLERQALAPIRMLGEMRDEGCAEGEAVPAAVRRVQAITEYRVRFREVFGGEEEKAVSAEHLAQAIAAFERTLVTPDTPFDRFLRGEVGAMNPDQKRGLEVFQSAGCAECHGGPMFSDFQRHWIGVVDGTPTGNRAFRTPTLRNLRRTAPYMHHGSLRTIREVLLFYEELGDAVSETLDGGDAAAQPRLDPLLRKLHLDPSDFNFLEAFLEALDGSEGLQVVPATVPSGLTIPSSL